MDHRAETHMTTSGSLPLTLASRRGDRSLQLAVVDGANGTAARPANGRCAAILRRSAAHRPGNLDVQERRARERRGFCTDGRRLSLDRRAIGPVPIRRRPLRALPLAVRRPPLVEQYLDSAGGGRRALDRLPVRRLQLRQERQGHEPRRAHGHGDRLRSRPRRNSMGGIVPAKGAQRPVALRRLRVAKRRRGLWHARRARCQPRVRSRRQALDPRRWPGVPGSEAAVLSAAGRETGPEGRREPAWSTTSPWMPISTC